MSACCSEPGCKRTEPVRLVQGGLSGHWFVVLRTEGGKGRVSEEKHRLPERIERELDAMLDAFHQATDDAGDAASLEAESP